MSQDTTHTHETPYAQSLSPTSAAAFPTALHSASTVWIALQRAATASRGRKPPDTTNAQGIAKPRNPARRQGHSSRGIRAAHMARLAYARHAESRRRMCRRRVDRAPRGVRHVVSASIARAWTGAPVLLVGRDGRVADSRRRAGAMVSM